MDNEIEKASVLHVDGLELKELDEIVQQNEAEFFVGSTYICSEQIVQDVE